MQVTVRFFASLRDLVGEGQCALDVPDGASVRDLADVLATRYPVLDGHQAGWHFAVNQVHAEADTILQDGDRLAIFPYVAGG